MDTKNYQLFMLVFEINVNLIYNKNVDQILCSV